MTQEDVRGFLANYLEEKFRGQGSKVTVLPDNCDLLLDGWIDSFDLLQLLLALRNHYGRDIDFEGLAPEEMTIVGPLCRYVSEQVGSSVNSLPAPNPL